MRVFLDAALAGHRRGRFLASLLNAEPAGEGPPASGLLVMTAKDFQTGSDTLIENRNQWLQQPGRTLLLVPPYTEGRLHPMLDWSAIFRSAKPVSSGVFLTDQLADEVVYALEGTDGALDRNAGHRWSDGSVNTRFHKVHTGTGLFAATCLPLWSITLMDAAEAVLAWLGALHAHTGPAEQDNTSVADPASSPTSGPGSSKAGRLAGLDPEAISLMVCLHGYDIGDLEQLIARLRASPLPVLNLAHDRLPLLAQRLRTEGLADQRGLTAEGLRELQASAYWGFAQRLREDPL